MYVCMYVSMNICIYIYIYIYNIHISEMGTIYICNHKNDVPSHLSPQWLCGKSWAHDV